MYRSPWFLGICTARAVGVIENFCDLGRFLSWIRICFILTQWWFSRNPFWEKSPEVVPSWNVRVFHGDEWIYCIGNQSLFVRISEPDLFLHFLSYCQQLKISQDVHVPRPNNGENKDGETRIQGVSEEMSSISKVSCPSMQKPSDSHPMLNEASLWPVWVLHLCTVVLIPIWRGTRWKVASMSASCGFVPFVGHSRNSIWASYSPGANEPRWKCSSLSIIAPEKSLTGETVFQSYGFIP